MKEKKQQIKKMDAMRNRGKDRKEPKSKRRKKREKTNKKERKKRVNYLYLVRIPEKWKLFSLRIVT